MRAADRSLDIITFVSEHFRDIIRRRLSELAGLALILLAMLGAIALATWSIQDPSLSHATQKPIHNLLGFPGAIFADLAMQLLGLAAILLLVPELLLGWRTAFTQAGRREMAQPSVDRGDIPCRRLRLDTAPHRIVAASNRIRRCCRRQRAASARMDFRLAARRRHAFHPVRRFWSGDSRDTTGSHTCAHVR